MCDSFVALADVCRDHYTIYGKVSDRAVNEPQYFVHVPAADHDCSKPLQCTLIQVEQVPHTYEMILSKPSWIWGAEIGVNEFGVCAGNETIYTKEVNRKPALMGMDLVRLALERGKTAKEALDVAASMLERYGQGGNCSFDEEFYYDNSFLFADPREAWVLETAGTCWAAKQVRGAHSISNYMTIGMPDQMCSRTKQAASDKGYRVTEPFDFTAAFMDWNHIGNHNGMVRKLCSQRVLDAANGQNTVRTAIAALQSHTSEDPFHSGNFSVCKHAVGRHGLHQSTNSMVVELKDNETVIWGAGMSLPCCSLYKPFWFDTYSDQVVYSYENQQDAMQNWLWREQINRNIICGKIDEQAYKAALKELQESVFQRYDQLKREDRKAFCEEVAAEEKTFLEFWLGQAEAAEENWNSTEDYQKFWEHFNAQLGRNRTICY